MVDCESDTELNGRLDLPVTNIKKIDVSSMIDMNADEVDIVKIVYTDNVSEITRVSKGSIDFKMKV